MKNRILALAAIAVTLGACSNDDDGPDYSQLTKKWYYVSDKVGSETIPYDDHEVCGKDYLQFMEDGTVVFADVWDCDAGSPVTDYQTSTYERSGKTITIEGESATITKLTSSTLQVKQIYDWDGDGEDDTVLINFTSNP